MVTSAQNIVRGGRQKLGTTDGDGHLPGSLRNSREKLVDWACDAYGAVRGNGERRVPGAYIVPPEEKPASRHGALHGPGRPNVHLESCTGTGYEGDRCRGNLAVVTAGPPDVRRERWRLKADSKPHEHERSRDCRGDEKDRDCSVGRCRDGGHVGVHPLG